LADFGIRGIVGEDDIFVPNELTFSGFYLLWRWKNMGVLREGAETEKAKDDKESGSHGWNFSAKITTKRYLCAKIIQL